MKILTSIMTLLLLSGSVLAQDNDTAALRKTGVKYIEHRSYMAIYGDRADTCVESKIWINEYGLTSKETVDHNCKGWDVVIENEYIYDSLRRMVKQVSTHNSAMQSEISYIYNDKNDIVEFEMLSFAPMLTIHAMNRLFYNKRGKADSIHRVTVVDTDSTFNVDRITYTKDKQIYFVKTYDENGKMILSNQYIYNDEGQVTELNVETITPEYSYSKNIYSYNEDGQLFSSTNTDEGATIQMWYNENGLIVLASHYNQFGQTVKNIHYKYTYR